MTDPSCPIGPFTFSAVYASAQSAIHAADMVLWGESVAYALCRPPSHHCPADLAGRFCYLSNSEIAAQQLISAGRQVAVLDWHHRNGAQGIFYDRPDVLTLSMHAHPEGFHPFFWGNAHERGAGAVHGFNINLTPERASGDEGFLKALDTACRAVADHGTDTLVLALGLDAVVGDPFAGLAATTSGFARIGSMVAGLQLPLVIVQEGGYFCPELQDNLTAVPGAWA